MHGTNAVNVGLLNRFSLAVLADFHCCVHSAVVQLESDDVYCVIKQIFLNAAHLYSRGTTNVPINMLKIKVFAYSIPSVGPGADPGVQAVSPQVTVSHPPGGRLPGLRLPPQPQSITALWPVPSYTAW